MVRLPCSRDALIVMTTRSDAFKGLLVADFGPQGFMHAVSAVQVPWR